VYTILAMLATLFVYYLGMICGWKACKLCHKGLSRAAPANPPDREGATPKENER